MAKSVLSRPFTVAKSAQTLDGKVATGNGRSQWITSTQTRAFARRRRDQFDAIIVGAQTVIADNPRLTGVRRQNLTKVIVDTTLRISLRAKVFAIPQNCWIATTRRADKKKLERLQGMGVNIFVCPQKRGRVNLSYLFDQLYRQGIKKLLIEGGPTLIGQAFREELVDQIAVYIAPKIMGQESGLDSVVGLNPKSIGDLCHLHNVKMRRINSDILVEADVYRNRRGKR